MKIEPTNPFRLVPLDAPAVRPVRPIARFDSAPGPARNARLEGVVAGVVPGGIDFSGARPEPAAAAIPMYRHPADRNAAATSVSAGRMIDITG